MYVGAAAAAGAASVARAAAAAGAATGAVGTATAAGVAVGARAAGTAAAAAGTAAAGTARAARVATGAAWAAQAARVGAGARDMGRRATRLWPRDSLMASSWGDSHYPGQAMSGGRCCGIGTRYTHTRGPEFGDQGDPLWHRGDRLWLLRGSMALGGCGRVLRCW